MHLLRLAAWSGLALAAVGSQPAPAALRSTALGRVQMAFEPNRGQADSTVQYLSRGRGYTLLLREREALLALSRGKDGTEAVAFQWLGTSQPAVRAENPTGGISNYFTAKLRQADIPHFARVRYAGLYRGIDLVYYGAERKLEYDVIIGPGADPAQPRFRIDGARSVSLQDGELHISLAEGTVVHRRPFVYQTKNGSRQQIEGEYVLLGRNEIGFRVGPYDRTRALVIDPVVAYSVARGAVNLGVEEGTAIAVDTAGNAYVTGYTTSSLFPTINAAQPFGGQADAFVMKINSTGTQVLYATFVGGTAADFGRGITVDNAGSAYIVGETISTDLPVNRLRTTYRGMVDGFLIKLAPAGNQFVYGMYLGGTGQDYATAVAIDLVGNLHVTGWTTSTDLNEVARLDSSPDAFLVRVNATATSLSSLYRGGAGDDRAYAVTVDTVGNAYIAGSTTTTNLAGTAFQPAKRGAAGTGDGFIAKFDSNLTPVYWAYYGGDANDVIRDIATDAAGSVYITGQSDSAVNFPVVGGLGLPGGGKDAFVAKLNSIGTALIYSTLLGGETEDIGHGIVVDTAGTAYVAGATLSAGFPLIESVKTTPPGLTFDAFVVRLNASANALLYSTLLGGSAFDAAQSIALDQAGDAYIAGSTKSPEIHGRSMSEQDAFAMKLTNGAANRFIPVTPCRIADTRDPAGPFGGPPIAAGTSRDFVVPGSPCGIPTTAVAYAMNVTVVPRGLLGFVTMWPAGQPRPNASTLNSYDGRVKANAAIVPAGTSGAVSVFATHTTDVILDIAGYFVPSTNTSALAFYPLTPCRIADTRLTTSPLGGPALSSGQQRSFPVRSSACGIPATAQSYSLNVTALPRGYLGHVTTWPTGGMFPPVSTLNAPTGEVTANAAIVPAGANGDISVYATNETDILIDINGYFAPVTAGGLSLYNVTPCRVADTREPAASPTFTGVRDINVAASACPVSPAAQAYVFNATVVPPGPMGHLTLWPQGQPQPGVSTLNAFDGLVTSNMAIVPAANGSISAFAVAPAHLVLDASGYFAP